MRQSVLAEPQGQFLGDEKEALAGFQVALVELDLPGEALDSLQKAILQLDELFLIVVAGEFNAGKSALINALLGQKVLPEGTTPTTSSRLRSTAMQVARNPISRVAKSAIASVKVATLAWRIAVAQAASTPMPTKAAPCSTE